MRKESVLETLIVALTDFGTMNLEMHKEVDVSKDRRKDNQLRESIDLLRANVQNLTSEHEVYFRLLEQLCNITKSPQAFVVKKINELHDNSLKLIDAYLFENSQVKIWQVENYCLTGFSASLFHSVFLHKTPRVYHAAELNELSLEELSFPKIVNMIAIPLAHSKDTLSVICLANSTIPYTRDQLPRFWPLLTTCISMIRMLQRHQELTQTSIDAAQGKESLKETLELLENHSPMGMIRLNTELLIISLNTLGKHVFDVNDDQAVIGKHISLLIPESFRNEHKTQTFAPVFPNIHQSNPLYLRGLTQNKKEVFISLTYITYFENHEKFFLVMFSDRTELDIAKENFEIESRRFKVLSDLSPIGILQTNRRWEAIYINEKWSKICQIPSKNLMGMGWVGVFDEKEAETVLKGLHASIEKGQQYSRECCFTHTSSVTWVELIARPIFDQEGNIDGIIATLNDSTFRHQAEEKLRSMAETDALTSLANRTLFVDRLEQAIKRLDRHGPFALLCLDLDGFKTINDSLGHDAGDILLIEVARRLKNCVREEDTVARVGGDEFMIVLEDLNDASDAAHVAEKILDSLSPPCQIHHQEVFISTSIGITFAVQSTSDSQTLIKQADIALYRAKAEGRRNYQYYSPELEKASKERLELGNSLHQALNRAEFEVYYQLQADVQTHTFTGLEALLRWKHDRKGVLAPPAFIQLLEETGLIVPVSRWLWYQAFLDHNYWIKNGYLNEHSQVSVNLSPRQLRDSKLTTGLEGALKDSGLKGEQVTVEITETALMEDSPQTTHTLREIKNLGISIALDDFGTGYSSLTYLKRFPIDKIKIDKSFVHDIINDAEDAAITRAVIALAKSLNLGIVAEGVENKATLNLLADWGCDVYQGYYLNKPMPANQLVTLIDPREKHA